MKKLTISIVNYNAGEYLIKCLESLKSVQKEADFDVYVVDNASIDGSIELAEKKFPQFHFIKNKTNLGFGKAHNLVLEKVRSPYLLTLNPDSEIQPGVLAYMLKYMSSNEDVGLATCKIVKPNGKLDIASHRGFPTPKASFFYFVLKNDKYYHLTDRDMNKIHEIDSAVGAFMMVRKSVLDKVGYFDEDYFLYAEDIDICFRIKAAGYKIMYVPDVEIKHIKGVSSGIKKDSQLDSSASAKTREKSVEYFYDTMKIFYKKHYAKKYPGIFNKIIYTGIDLKKSLSLRKNKV